MSEDTRCTYINPKTKNRCKARRLKGEDLCFMHSPTTKEKRELAQKMGGHKHYQIEPVKTKFIDVEGVLGLLEETVGELRAMSPSVPKSRAIISACVTAMELMKVTELERRISDLEQKASKDEDS